MRPAQPDSLLTRAPARWLLAALAALAWIPALRGAWDRGSTHAESNMGGGVAVERAALAAGPGAAAAPELVSVPAPLVHEAVRRMAVGRDWKPGPDLQRLFGLDGGAMGRVNAALQTFRNYMRRSRLAGRTAERHADGEGVEHFSVTFEADWLGFEDVWAREWAEVGLPREQERALRTWTLESAAMSQDGGGRKFIVEALANGPGGELCVISGHTDGAMESYTPIARFKTGAELERILREEPAIQPFGKVMSASDFGW